MQFKHPEIFYFLFALLIPIFIHLFQLQRFTKVPFTNVFFLKQLELQTRKSSRLKKMLVLLSRLAAFVAVIFAFAQPYFAKSNQSKDWETIFVIDNSISMQAKGKKGELLKNALHEIILNTPEKGIFSIFTPQDSYKNLSKESFKELVKTIFYTPYTTDLNPLVLQLKQYIQSQKDKKIQVVWVSDFQNIPWDTSFYKELNVPLSIVPLTPLISQNVSIDSVALMDFDTSYKNLKVFIRNQGDNTDPITLSAYHNKILLSKTSVSLSKDTLVETQLRIAGEMKEVRLEIDVDDRYLFDNKYQISFNEHQQIPILIVSENNTFLHKIFRENEFDITTKNFQNIPYNQLGKFNIVILNEPKNFQALFSDLFRDYIIESGHVVLIPWDKMPPSVLDSFSEKMYMGKTTFINDSSLVTKIHFAHPVFQNVFEKKFDHFQYPFVKSYFQWENTGFSPILSFQNDVPFLLQKKIGKGNLFVFSSALNSENSNFTHAPLVVPIFYKMAKMSDLQPQLSYSLGEEQPIEISKVLEKDAILSLKNDAFSIIPAQEVHTDHVVLQVGNDLPNPGFYHVMNSSEYLQSLAFNVDKRESLVHDWDTQIQDKLPDNTKVFLSVADAMNDIISQQEIQSYFKWFIFLALGFLLIELALLKYL